MKGTSKRFSPGMTLVEIMIVLTVLLVIFAAVFLFFTRGTEEFDFSRKQNELATIGRLALEEVTDVIIYAGYMPGSQWESDDWHPVVLADSAEFEFYADYEGDGVLDNHDYRHITVSNGSFLVTDRGDYSRRVGSNISDMEFSYLDQFSNPLPVPATEADRDQVRHIRIDLTLNDSYRGTPYFTEVSTTISPRNLGINHNINPAFHPPSPLSGTVVFNINGSGEEQNPTPDEFLMINRMSDWGLTVIPLTDYQMGIYDFRGDVEIDLIILRHRGVDAWFPHTDMFYKYAGNKDTLFIPVVTLNARDAVEIFDMGGTALDLALTTMTPVWDHPVNRHLPNGLLTFDTYEPFSTGKQSVLADLDHSVLDDHNPLTLPGVMDDHSGVTVRDERTDKRRVHFSAHDASEYTDNGGWRMFYNVIKWNIGDPGSSLGTLIEREDFENPDDYSWVEPGYGADSYCYVVTPRISVPAEMDDDYSAILRFAHCYWTRNRQAGGYIDISTDSLNWTQVPDEDLLVGYYHQPTKAGFPGGEGISAYIDKSPGYSPSGPTLTIEEVSLDGYRDTDVWIRWVFGVESKESNNQDGWVVDDLRALLIDGVTGDSIRFDPWGLHEDSLRIQPRFWRHHEIFPFNDDWYYHHLYNVDPIYPYEQGYAWTTWGEIGYIGPWTHGGTNSSWEIGVMVIPEFTPWPDPPATPECGWHYAGNDLTYDDGLYNVLETSYLLSERYEVSKTDPYDIIQLTIYRCIRMAPTDDAWIHVGFSTDTFPPIPFNEWDQWWRVDSYDVGVNHLYWEYEVDPPIDLTEAFEEALAEDDYEYYWLLFTVIAGPSTNKRGGWNLDNIEIWGNNL